MKKIIFLFMLSLMLLTACEKNQSVKSENNEDIMQEENITEEDNSDKGNNLKENPIENKNFTEDDLQKIIEDSFKISKEYEMTKAKLETSELGDCYRFSWKDKNSNSKILAMITKEGQILSFVRPTETEYDLSKKPKLSFEDIEKEAQKILETTIPNHHSNFKIAPEESYFSESTHNYKIHFKRYVNDIWVFGDELMISLNGDSAEVDNYTLILLTNYDLDDLSEFPSPKGILDKSIAWKKFKQYALLQKDIIRVFDKNLNTVSLTPVYKIDDPFAIIDAFTGEADRETIIPMTITNWRNLDYHMRYSQLEKLSEDSAKFTKDKAFELANKILKDDRRFKPIRAELKSQNNLPKWFLEFEDLENELSKTLIVIDANEGILLEIEKNNFEKQDENLKTALPIDLANRFIENFANDIKSELVYDEKLQTDSNIIYYYRKVGDFLATQDYIRFEFDPKDGGIASYLRDFKGDIDIVEDELISESEAERILSENSDFELVYIKDYLTDKIVLKYMNVNKPLGYMAIDAISGEWFNITNYFMDIMNTF
ncbi:MAG: hypothetical protein Q4P29_03355 [Tissierellia bacterium]|nr:hypothetical protein [Tissierellia bacterium]